MSLMSFLPASYKSALKRIILPLLRIVSGSKTINTQYKFIEYSRTGCHTYFGYYDISPFQGDNVIYIEREWNSDVCKVVLNDIHNSAKKYIAESHAWNWQQGIRLRWLSNSTGVISFNDYKEGKYINRIININAKEEKVVSWPLYDISPDGKSGITLDFERLGVMRPGYGYTYKPYKAGDLWKDGISIIDIEKNRLVKTITYKELSDNIKKADDVSHFYLNHLSFSPDGTKFLFFWIDEDNGFDQASLGVYDLTTEEIIPLETEGKASHYVWDGNDEIVCTVLDRNYFARYCRFNVKERSKTIICDKSLLRDGHPSIYAQGVILTDTYPDTRGFQHLYLANEKEDSKTEILKIYSVPTANVEKRTDLHPRLSQDKRFISIDSNHDRYRKMLVLKLEK